MRRRVGHKGADHLEAGNTIGSFERAAAEGVDTIEFDVLWTPAGSPELPTRERAPLVVAHDWEAVDAHPHPHPTLDEALEAFTRPPLEGIEIDCDIKLPGRERDLVDALRHHDLIERAMISTPHVEAIEALKRIEPRLRRGRTFPKVSRAWDQIPLALPAVAVALAIMRRRLPSQIARSASELGLFAIWSHYRLVTAAVVAACRKAEVELIVWTVDDATEVERLTRLGVDGICSNDPRLLTPESMSG